MAVNLTDTAIKAAKPAAHVIRMRDNRVTGLNLTITPQPKKKGATATKTFYFQFSSPETGSRRFKKLGVYPGYSLEEARAEALNLQKQVQRYIDPIEQAERDRIATENAVLRLAEKAEKKAQKKRMGTVDQLFELYLADLEWDKKNTKDIEQAYKLDIQPFIGSRRAKDITADDIGNILAIIVERGAMRKSGLVRGYLHRAFNLGLEAPTSVRWKKTAPKFNLVYNPASQVKNPDGKSVPGNRVLSEAEVKRLWAEAGTTLMRNDSAIALKLMLSTGQRTLEVLHAEWSEFDLDGKEWVIPFERRKIRHKALHREGHIVPLCDIHIDLLIQLQGMTGSSRYLFPKITEEDEDEKPRTHNSLQQAVARFCVTEKTKTRPATVRFTRFSPRDLRRTMKTLSGKAGIDKETRDRLQGHAFQDVSSKNYDRYDYWPEKQQAMQQWCDYLEALVNSTKPVNVVSFKKGVA